MSTKGNKLKAVMPLLFLLLQVFTLSQGAAVFREPSAESNGVGGGPMKSQVHVQEGGMIRVKKQTTGNTREWTVSDWSECTVSCGGGVRTRSVRCLDEDGVISRDCEQTNVPLPWELCNQIDCGTSDPQPGLLPSTGDYTLTNGDGSTTTLFFDNRGPSNYEVQQNTTEADGTAFQSTSRVTPPGNVQTMSQISSRTYNLGFLSGGERTQLIRDGESLLTLDGIQRVEIKDDQEIVFKNSVISFGNGGPVITNSADQLIFYDGFRFYEFKDEKINSLPGPGTLYIDPLTSTALFSTEDNLNIRLNQVIDSLTAVSPTDPPEEIISTSDLVTLAPITVSTPSTTQTTSDPVVSILPITDEPTSSEEEVTDETPSTESSVSTRPESTTKSPESTTSQPESTSPDLSPETEPEMIETRPETEPESSTMIPACIESSTTSHHRKSRKGKSRRTKKTKKTHRHSKTHKHKSRKRKTKKSKGLSNDSEMKDSDESTRVNCNPVPESSVTKKTTPRKSHSRCTRTHHRHHHHRHHHHSRSRHTHSGHTHHTHSGHTHHTHSGHTHHNHSDHTHHNHRDHTHHTRRGHTHHTHRGRHTHHHHCHVHHDHSHTRHRTHTHHTHRHRDHTHDTPSRHTTTSMKRGRRYTNTLNDDLSASSRSKRQTNTDTIKSSNAREARQVQAGQDSIPLDLESPTLNFELTLVDSRIFLSHNGQRFIDVTNPTKTEITDSMLIAFKDNTLTVIDEVTRETITQYEDIEHFSIFNGTDVVEISDPYGPEKASNGQLYVSGNQAFFSNNKQFNELLEEQLKRVVPDRAQVMLMFEVLPNGDQMLLVDGTPVIQLNGAEVIDIPNRDFLQYANNTIFVQDFIEGMLDQSFPGITQFFVLNGIRPGLETYMEVVTNEIPGGGRLYVHNPTGRAFYSRDDRINDAITEHINSLSQPPPSIIFSIRFEPSPNGIPDVVVLANGNEVVRLLPDIVEDHGLSPTQHLIYSNNSVLILMGDVILGAVDDIDELVFFDGTQIIMYQGSAPEIIAGGGQIFVSGNQGFYSLNSDLNDRIGEALRAAEELVPATLPPIAPTTPDASSEPGVSTDEATTESEVSPSTDEQTEGPFTTEEPDVSGSKPRRTKPSRPSPPKTKSSMRPTRPGPTPDMTVRPKPPSTPRSPRTHPTSAMRPSDRSVTQQTADTRPPPRTKPTSKKHRRSKYRVKAEERPPCTLKDHSCCNRLKPAQRNESTHHHRHHHHHSGVKTVMSRKQSSTSAHSTPKRSGREGNN